MRGLGNEAAPEYTNSYGGGEIFGGTPYGGGGGGGGGGYTFPFSYENGVYTWNDSSFENQTINSIDARRQFPSGGFINNVSDVPPGLIYDGALYKPTTATPTAAAPAALAPASTATIPKWGWWLAGIIGVALLLPE